MHGYLYAVPGSERLIEYKDGYGNPFPEEAQIRHLENVRAGILANLSRVIETRPALLEPPPERDKPAGWYDKTPKNTLSLDASQSAES